jgi:hypothetical protein
MDLACEDRAIAAIVDPAELLHHRRRQAAAADGPRRGSFGRLDLKDRLMRVLADQENFRRRVEREREDAVRFAATQLIKDLLQTADNLSRALESLPPDLPVQNAAMRNLLAKTWHQTDSTGARPNTIEKDICAMTPNWLPDPLRQPSCGFVDKATRCPQPHGRNHHRSGQLMRYKERST